MRYWTSDLHIGHERIIEFCDRPFANEAEMRAELLRRWNATVTDEDEVWIVGDLAMGEPEETIPWCAQLNGSKILIPGNHDPCWRGGRKDWATFLPLYAEAGIMVLEHRPGDCISAFLPTPNQETPVGVCHFQPKRQPAQRWDDKFSAWRPDGFGWLIHGHTHQPTRIKGQDIHVGVDAWYYAPVSDEQLVDLIYTASH